MSCGVEVNLGPKSTSCQSHSFSTCHWNLTNLAQSFAKVSFLTNYLSVNKFDIECLLETFLNSEILTDTLFPNLRCANKQVITFKKNTTF